MDTYCQARRLAVDPGYGARRRKALAALDHKTLDPPMAPLVAAFNRLPYCYTLQCCHGHVVVPGQGPPEHWQRLPVGAPPARALYQLAYVAMVVRNDPAGLNLLRGLALVAARALDFMQMGSAEWFWEDQGEVNSYILQVSPRRCQDQDRFEMPRSEAREWLAAREKFMAGLEELAQGELERLGSG